MAEVQTPIYRIELTLAPASDSAEAGSALGNLSGLVAATGLGVISTQEKNEALAILTSRTFVADFIRENELMPTLYPEAFDSASQPDQTAGAEGPTLGQAVTRILNGMMRVTEDLRSGLIQLRMDYKDPELALAWSRDLVARVNEVARRRDMAETEETIAYLERALGETAQVSTRDAIGRVLEEHLQRSALANARREYAFRVLEPGMIPDRPIRPRRLRMVLAGFAIMGLLAAFFFCAREGVFSPRLLPG